MAPEPPHFDRTFQDKLRSLFAWRRDVRRFRTDPLPEGALEALLDALRWAPSVGLSQPGRFVIVADPARRQAIVEMFKTCNAEALAAYTGDTATHYARLKLAGLEEAPCHLAVFADRDTPQGRDLGRRTMPEMAEYSTVTAIHTLWLLSRAEGIGMGWISILYPSRIARLLDVPDSWHFIGYFCLGFPLAESETPELEREAWDTRRPSGEFVLWR